MNRLGQLISGAIAAFALVACQGSVLPTAAPSTSASAAPKPTLPAPSPESLALAGYYKSIQRSLLTQGLLRRDGGGADVPYSAAMLARNFTRIAFFNEYTKSGGGLVAKAAPSHLTRWEDPIRVSVHFGPSVPPKTRTKDRATIGKFVNRLARVTQHPIAISVTGNFRVYIVNEDERRAMSGSISDLIPGISPASQRAIINMPRDTYCLVVGRDPLDTGRLDQAVAFIRAEHPDLMRTSCIHEEIAQGLGLSNDSPAARPSIFNDDEEFGLLTTHDEHLLKILYDKRLSPGMTASQAQPIITTIAAEILGDDT